MMKRMIMLLGASRATVVANNARIMPLRLSLHFLLILLVVVATTPPALAVVKAAFTPTTTSFKNRQQQHHHHHHQLIQFAPLSWIRLEEKKSTQKRILHFPTSSIMSSSSSLLASSRLSMSDSDIEESSKISNDNDNNNNVTSTQTATATTTTASSLNPSWRKILEIPITVETKQQFDSIPLFKRLAIVSRVSVLHLTLLSCAGPFILRSAIIQAAKTTTTGAATAAAATSTALYPLTPLLAMLFTIDGLSWHAVHNLLNDWQDLNDDDNVEDAFRLAYGCHALKQGFLTKQQFLKIMTIVAMPGIILTLAFAVMYNSILAPAAVYGILALVFYTILFKPFAMGEILIYLVWGPLMAGFGQLASGGAAPWISANRPLLALLTDPIVAIFGLSALAVIMGKHTDKISTSRKRTLPKVLGFPAATWACGLTIIAPHIVLACTLFHQRLWPMILSSASSSSATAATAVAVAPTLPWGAALGFLTLLREVPLALKVLAKGPPTAAETNHRQRPPLWARGKVFTGTLVNANVNQAWPLWFVAFCGWHALTFTYLVVIGSALDWALRVALARFGVSF